MIDTLKEHLQRYPQMQGQDIIKLCFQNEFGCEHMLHNQKKSLQRIIDESQSLSKQAIRVELIGNGFARLYFGHLTTDEAYTLHQLFAWTARTYQGNTDTFIHKLEECQQWLNDKVIHQEIDQYLKNGIYPISHSPRYHEEYDPHYRVIRADLAFCFPLFLKINQLHAEKETLLIAIDGKCGSGKTTLAGLLNEVYQGNVFHMDDFFLQPHQRSSKRLETPGENVDHERFLKEVMKPLSQQQDILYQPFDCSIMQLSDHKETVPFHAINFIEGTYSLHPDLIDYYDLKIITTIDDETQMERILKRNGPDLAKKFKEIWIPLENNYFKQLDIFSKADIRCSTKNNHVDILP
ncbi:hypothetical protein [Beduini sp.]|uniref:uridine kinase family protein n=1 Tax=Beduini sp. TaxID=1922300 RepID=UPI0011C7E995